MKKILVPTDFSAIAANAYRFAQRLALKEEAEITVIHAHHPSFDYSNPYLDLPAQEFEQVKKELLNNFMGEHTLPSKTGGVVTLPKAELRIGFAAEEITRAAKEADIVIMGTTGEGNLLEKVFGSVSTYVASHANCPVLLIPGNCSCRDFSNIVYASNHQPADEVMLKQVVGMIDIEPASVHFVHVDVDEVEGDNYEIRKAAFKDTMQTEMPGVGINEVSIGCDDVQKGIISYAEDNNADLIVMATSHRSFLERMFHKSVTKEAVFHTTIPLMVLHYDQ